MDTKSENWKPIKKIEMGNLQMAREHMHEAIQLVALIGRGLLAGSDEDSNANLEWISDLEAFAGHCVGDAVKFRAALDLKDLRFFIMDQAHIEHASFDLTDKSPDQAFEWVKTKFFELGFESSVLSQNPPYNIPEFKYNYFRTDYSPSAYKTLSALFGNAHLILQQVNSNAFNTPEIRCWPHHFDIATLMTHQRKQGNGQTVSIGLGFSPGDDDINEPYFYVNCWPHPDLANQDPPVISNGGRWNLQGWIGTVLTYNMLLTAEDQYQTTKEFLISSIKALRQI